MRGLGGDAACPLLLLPMREQPSLARLPLEAKGFWKKNEVLQSSLFFSKTKEINPRIRTHAVLSLPLDMAILRRAR